MNVKVRFFASMRDRMGRAEDEVSVQDGSVTVSDVWAKVAPDQPMPDSTLIAINMEYTDAAALVKEGDEVAFFPPVTGG